MVGDNVVFVADEENRSRLQGFDESLRIEESFKIASQLIGSK